MLLVIGFIGKVSWQRKVCYFHAKTEEAARATSRPSPFHSVNMHNAERCRECFRECFPNNDRNDHALETCLNIQRCIILPNTLDQSWSHLSLGAICLSQSLQLAKSQLPRCCKGIVPMSAELFGIYIVYHIWYIVSEHHPGFDSCMKSAMQIIWCFRCKLWCVYSSALPVFCCWLLAAPCGCLLTCTVFLSSAQNQQEAQ